MHILSYLVHVHPGKVAEVATALNAYPKGDATGADNRDLVILVVETGLGLLVG